jgi:hypothetical protein
LIDATYVDAAVEDARFAAGPPFAVRLWGVPVATRAPLA